MAAHGRAGGSRANANIESGAPKSSRATGNRYAYRAAVLAACDRFEKDQEDEAKHGPVIKLWENGKRVERP